MRKVLLYAFGATASLVITCHKEHQLKKFTCDGFPAKAMVKVAGHSLTPIYYNYIVK